MLACGVFERPEREAGRSASYVSADCFACVCVCVRVCVCVCWQAKRLGLACSIASADPDTFVNSNPFNTPRALPDDERVRQPRGASVAHAP
jgi:hypothetical protein